MARVLVTRPEPGASRTARALAAAGHEAVVRPLMRTEAADWTMPAGDFDAVMLTSAAAARHAGPAAAALTGLPALCVGAACRAAARAAGFLRAEAAGDDVKAVVGAAARYRRVVHLAGVERTDVVVPEGLELVVCEVYRAVLLPLSDSGDVDAVMLYSARSARHFSDEWARLVQRRDIAVVAMSAAVAAAAGDDWGRMIVAAAPNEASMLAALADAGL